MLTIAALLCEQIMMQSHLDLWDFILTPIFIFIFSSIAKRQRDKRYPTGHPLRQYFMKGLYLKFVGAIFIAFIFEYYYGGGDTYHFFYHAKVINTSLDDSFTTWFKLIMRRPVNENPELYKYVSQNLEWYFDPSSFSVVRVTAIFGLFTGTHYLPIAIMFAYFSFTGIWAMYRTFVNIYPKLYKELAIAFLFIPSTFVWGSGVFKDTICMFGVGWLTYTTFRLFINRDFSTKNIFMLVVSFYVVYATKLYILMAFVPALSIWLLTTYTTKIKSSGIRFLAKIIFIAICSISFYVILNVFASEFEKYSLDNIAQTAETTRGWLLHQSGDEGSGYDLGAFDPSIGGMLVKFPQAVVATLFRPFPWEARKVIVMLSALEALLFVYFTFKAFQRKGILKTLGLVMKDPNLLFFITFSLIFAFAVGISTYNFGALSRYKIPCLPFYGAFLLIVINYEKTPRGSINQLKRSKKVSALA
jgi:hypothetical protein